MKHYLIIDIGTGNSRVALTDAQHNIIDLETVENRYHRDSLYQDAQYFSADYWKKIYLSLCKDIIKRNPSAHIDAITSSGARQSFVVLDKQGKELIGLPNIDNRGKQYMSEIKNKKTIYHKSGRWVTEDFGAGKLLGLKKGRAEIYQEAKTFTSVSEWIGYIFTGKLCMEPSQACETQLYDVADRCWDPALLETFGLNELSLPELKNAGTKLADISDSIKEVIGVAYDIPFVIGGADTQLALAGTKIQAGDIGIVSGTTSPVVTMRSTYYIDKEEGVWSGCYLGNKLFQVETNPGVTGLNYQRVRKLLFKDVSYEDLEYILADVKEIKCVAFLSSLDFENASGYPTGGFFMRPPFSQDFHREDLVWAVVADIACSIYYQYKQLSAKTVNQRNYILGCGGGFQSKMLSQHVADLTQCELRLPKNFAQASILGCIQICNDYYGIAIDEQDENAAVYYPNPEDGLIQDYYHKWIHHRNRIVTTREVM